MTVISLNLNHKQYGDCGIVALRASDAYVSVVPIGLSSVGLDGVPDADQVASFLASLAGELSAEFVFPDEGLDHARRCEQELAMPARTGLPGEARPAEHLGFAQFCISLFDALSTQMFPRLSTTGDWPTHVAVESCPTCAWQSLGISPLPGKGETTPADLDERLKALESCFPIDVRGELSHNELQATVAGMAGVALERRNLAGIAFAGVEPMLVDGAWREGYILSPTREAANLPG